MPTRTKTPAKSIYAYHEAIRIPSVTSIEDLDAAVDVVAKTGGTGEVDVAERTFTIHVTAPDLWALRETLFDLEISLAPLGFMEWNADRSLVKEHSDAG